MTPARRNPARKDESVQLSSMFAEAGWAPADQNFRERPFVIWHGSFYSVSGTPPNGSPCSKACQTAEEVLEFLTSKTVVVASSSNIATDSPDTAPWASPDVRAALDPFVPMEADAVDPEKEALRARIAELEQIIERAAEPPPLSPDPVKHMIPDEIRKLMQGEETLPQARQRLWPILNAELGELKNQEALFNKTIPRRAEVEQLISILARLGEG